MTIPHHFIFVEIDASGREREGGLVSHLIYDRSLTLEAINFERRRFRRPTVDTSV